MNKSIHSHRWVIVPAFWSLAFGFAILKAQTGGSDPTGTSIAPSLAPPNSGEVAADSFRNANYAFIPLAEPASNGEDTFQVQQVTDSGDVVILRTYSTDEEQMEGGGDGYRTERLLWKKGVIDKIILKESYNLPSRSYESVNRAGLAIYRESVVDDDLEDENSPDLVGGYKSISGQGQVTPLLFPGFSEEVDSQYLEWETFREKGRRIITSMSPHGNANVGYFSLTLLEDGTAFGAISRSRKGYGVHYRWNDREDSYYLPNSGTCTRYYYWESIGATPTFFEGAMTRLEDHHGNPYRGMAEAGGMGANAFFVSRTTTRSDSGKYTHETTLRGRDGKLLSVALPAEFSRSWELLATSRNGHIVQTTGRGVTIFQYPKNKTEVLGPAFGGYEAQINDVGDLLLNRYSAANMLVRKFIDPTTQAPVWAVRQFSNDTLPEGWSDLFLTALANAQPLSKQRELEAMSPPAYPPKPENTPLPMLGGTAVKDGKRYPVLLLPVEVVELAPLVRDEDGNEDPFSMLPNKGNPLTPFVEEDPHSNRIAHRELKVQIGEPLKGKTVTWTMEPLFRRTPGPYPFEFRGKWTTADASHRNRFEASTAFGLNGCTSLSQESGRTTVADDGFTAIRVNVPPVGFNAARIKIQIEGIESLIDLIDMEVPAAIVIDPGHGGTDSGAEGSSDATVLEKNLALPYGLDLREELIKKFRKEKRGVRIFMTRDDDTFVSKPARPQIAKNRGADVFLSIHFNSTDNTTTRGTEVLVERIPGQIDGDTNPPFPGDNKNQTEDINLADLINPTTFNAVESQDNGAVARRLIKRGTVMLQDVYFGNIDGYHLVSACLIEVEFLSHAAALQTVRIPGVKGEAIKDAFAVGVTDDIYNNILTQP